MDKKDKRHARIIELVNENSIERQEELVDMLNKEGYQVTQATISRDIRELKLVKISLKNGTQKYALNNNAVDDSYSEKYTRILRDSIVSMDTAQNLLVIKTGNGMAMAAAAAIDSLKLPGCVGCIAGDDTIMAAVKSADEAHMLVQLIKELIY